MNSYIGFRNILKSLKLVVFIVYLLLLFIGPLVQKKLSIYYTLYSIVLIFNNRVTSLLTRPILENSHTKVFSWLNNIILKISRSLNRMSPTIIRSNYSSFNYTPRANLIYYSLIK